MVTLVCPQGDSNSCLSLERAPSWATRRWGRLALLTYVSDVVQTRRARLSRTLHSRCRKACGIVSRMPHSFLVKRAGLYHPNLQSSTSVLAVPWTSVLAAICLANRVHEKDVHFARSMHTDRVRHFNITGARGTCDDYRRPGGVHDWQGQCICK